MCSNRTQGRGGASETEKKKIILEGFGFLYPPHRSPPAPTTTPSLTPSHSGLSLSPRPLPHPIISPILSGDFQRETVKIKDFCCSRTSREEEENSRFALAECQESGRCHLKEAQDFLTGWGRVGRIRLGRIRGRNANTSSSNASNAAQGWRNKMHFSSFGGASCVTATQHEGCDAMANPPSYPPHPHDPKFKASHYISKGPHLISSDDERLVPQRRRLFHR